MAGKGNRKTPYLFIAPFLVMFAAFKLYQMVYGFAVSFLDRNSTKKLTSTAFAGLKNYTNVLASESFWQSLGRSFVFAFVYTLTVMVLGFIFAVLFNTPFKGRKAVRTMFYMPYVTNIIAVGIVFKYLLNPTKGPVNAIFRLFGAEGPKWLSSPVMALPTAAVIGAWLALAFNIITVLAALQEIPNELYEVAELEGATFSQRIRHIILPMLVPALFMLLTITVINSFKSYTTIVTLTGGGPGTSTRTLSYQIYEDAFTYMKFSIASAEGVLMTLVIIVVNAILGRVRKVWEEK